MNLQLFTLADDDGTTKILFTPHPISGPPRPTSLRGPRLDYQGVEGNFSFRGGQVGILESPLGSLISVGLLDFAVTVTLALPPINMAGKEKQTFDTVAIKTQDFGVQKEGAAFNYSVLLLHGVAEQVEPPP